MAGVKGNRGGQPGRSGRRPGFVNPTAGRKQTSLRNLENSVNAAKQMFSGVGDIISNPVLSYCASCGAWGWEPFHAVVWGLDFGVVEGAEPLATVPMAGQELRHSKNCPNATTGA